MRTATWRCTSDAPIERLRAAVAQAAERRDFEYAALLRDRAERLEEFRGRLIAWMGKLDGLTFLYRVPGFRGEDRLYLVRRGRVREEVEYPKSARTRVGVADLVEEIFQRRGPTPRALDGDEAAEILIRRQLVPRPPARAEADQSAARVARRAAHRGSYSPREGHLVPQGPLADPLHHAVVAREEVGGADALVAQAAQRFARVLERQAQPVQDRPPVAAAPRTSGARSAINSSSPGRTAGSCGAMCSFAIRVKTPPCAFRLGSWNRGTCTMIGCSFASCHSPLALAW